jgi:hypothetical protein
LKRFWEVESVSSDSIDPEIPSKQQYFVQNIRFTGARYAVGLPWKGNDHNIEDNYELCRNRLKSLHQKLLKDPKYLDEYNRNNEEQLATGIVEKVPPSDKDQKNIHYLPHHGVIRKDKATTKLMEQSNYVAVYRRKGPLVGKILGAINSKCKASTTEGDRKNKSFLRRAPKTRG